MKFNLVSVPDVDVELWHDWFAWYPVETDAGENIAWLEHVERKLLCNFWIYRTKA